MSRDDLARTYARRANYWLCLALDYELRALCAHGLDEPHRARAFTMLEHQCRRQLAATYARLVWTRSDCR